MSRIRQFAPLLLVAIFWIAQLHGTVHGISHLGGPSGISDHFSATHSDVCFECAALAQAGAAPLPSLPVAALPLALDRSLVDSTATAVLAAPAAHDYRSRAPPRTPI